MTRTKLYSELFNRYNRERRQFFLDCREESGRQNLRMLRKITILLVPFILFAFFFTPFLIRGWTISLSYYVLFGFVVLTAGISIFLCFETKDLLSCGKYNLYIIYTGDVYNNRMD